MNIYQLVLNIHWHTNNEFSHTIGITYFPKPISPGLFLYADHVIASLSNVEGLNTPNMDLLHKDKDGEGVKQGFAGVFVQNMEARFPLGGAIPVDWNWKKSHWKLHTETFNL